MRKLLLISLLAVLGIAVNAQKYVADWTTADTLKGNVTRYYPSSAGYDCAGIGTGVINFTFTHTDKTDSLNYARIEFLNNASASWVALTGTAALTLTTTDGQSVLYTTTPILHKKYRVALHTAAGDTVKITNATLLIKNN
jgi:hypothetical protein